METLDTILKLVRPGCFMATVDLKDAYYSVAIRENTQQYLKLFFDGTLYKYLALLIWSLLWAKEIHKATKISYSSPKASKLHFGSLFR